MFLEVLEAKRQHSSASAAAILLSHTLYFASVLQLYTCVTKSMEYTSNIHEAV